jgi:hypothetical protein
LKATAGLRAASAQPSTSSVKTSVFPLDAVMFGSAPRARRKRSAFAWPCVLPRYSGVLFSWFVALTAALSSTAVCIVLTSSYTAAVTTSFWGLAPRNTSSARSALSFRRKALQSAMLLLSTAAVSSCSTSERSLPPSTKKVIISVGSRMVSSAATEAVRVWGEARCANSLNRLAAVASFAVSAPIWGNRIANTGAFLEMSSGSAPFLIVGGDNETTLSYPAFNGNGQLWTGGTAELNKWTKIAVNKGNFQAKGRTKAYAVADDASLWEAVYNRHRQLGTGTTTNVERAAGDWAN